MWRSADQGLAERHLFPASTESYAECGRPAEPEEEGEGPGVCPVGSLGSEEPLQVSPRPWPRTEPGMLAVSLHRQHHAYSGCLPPSAGR